MLSKQNIREWRPTMDYVLEMILSVLKNNVSSAILFGSRAKGTNTDRSDYDIAVSGVTDYDKLIEDIDNLEPLYKLESEVI